MNYKNTHNKMNENSKYTNINSKNIKTNTNDINMDTIDSNWNETIDSFDLMDLKEDLLRGIYAYGFEKPSEIQKLAIKPTIQGRDIIGQARSGTGKTGTFGISILERIDEKDSKTQSLILAPTRELVEQITMVIQEIGMYLDVTVEGFVGGRSIRDDINKLKKGVQIVVGTPGRIGDLIDKGKLNLDDIKIFVMDEVDEMLSRGFIEQVQKIFVELDESAQIALFSATITNEVKFLSNKMMKDPIKIFIPLHEQTLEGIPQYYVKLQETQKLDVIKDLYNSLTLGTSIIFCNSIKTVDFLTDELKTNDFAVSSIHGGMTQIEREEKLKQLRKGNTRLLITTDILSRGIDVQQLSMVLNYDLPYEVETYIHRIGRCGRFGRKGIAINLANSKDLEKLNFIEKYYDTIINELPANLDNLIK